MQSVDAIRGLVDLPFSLRIDRGENTLEVGFFVFLIIGLNPNISLDFYLP